MNVFKQQYPLPVDLLLISVMAFSRLQYTVIILYATIFLLHCTFADAHEIPNLANGPLTSFRIQRSVINCLIIACGVNLLEYADGKNRGYPLEPLIKESKARYAPTVHSVTIRRWFYYYMLEGETPACRSRRHTRLRACRLRHQGFSNKRKAQKSNDTVELKRLLDDFPCLYLEEICYGLEIINKFLFILR